MCFKYDFRTIENVLWRQNLLLDTAKLYYSKTFQLNMWTFKYVMEKDTRNQTIHYHEKHRLAMQQHQFLFIISYL